MFVLRVSTWFKALEPLRPDIAAAAQTAWQGKTIDKPFIRPVKTTLRCGRLLASQPRRSSRCSRQCGAGRAVLADTSNTFIHAGSRLVGLWALATSQ